jgi:hypothetical protein
MNKYIIVLKSELDKIDFSQTDNSSFYDCTRSLNNEKFIVSFVSDPSFLNKINIEADKTFTVDEISNYINNTVVSEWMDLSYLDN